jgi:[CysO sulfur-carrier protein]-S-L-cysteine hydrolase
MGLILSQQHYAALLAHAEAEQPNEACGMLAGIGGRVYRVYQVENIHHSPTVYELNPAQQIAAFLDLEAAGWELNGIYHSHPAGPAEPSPTDIAQAYYPDSVYVIVSPMPASGTLAPGGRAWQARGFRIEAHQVREVPIVVEDSSRPPEAQDLDSTLRGD